MAAAATDPIVNHHTLGRDGRPPDIEAVVSVAIEALAVAAPPSMTSIACSEGERLSAGTDSNSRRSISSSRVVVVPSRYFSSKMVYVVFSFISVSVVIMSDEREEVFTKLSACPAEVIVYGIYPDVEEGGYLFVGITLQLVQLVDLPA